MCWIHPPLAGRCSQKSRRLFLRANRQRRLPYRWRAQPNHRPTCQDFSGHLTCSPPQLEPTWVWLKSWSATSAYVPVIKPRTPPLEKAKYPSQLCSWSYFLLSLSFVRSSVRTSSFSSSEASHTRRGKRSYHVAPSPAACRPTDR